nr:hypothetical protein [Chroococcidiopsis thermalis]
MTQEEQRLQEDRDRKAHWRRWGSYLSERQWGTVREDYSADGSAWDYFSHEQARSRAYRWGEDGIAGISDNHQRLCFAIALWNGVDPILKERLFGLTGNEGNHGEDVKECYFYLDNTPTHSYMKYLYKYSQQAFPYTQLVTENQNRSKRDREFELLDTGIFDNNTYFDVFVEYAKNTPEDILIKISIANRALETRNLYLLPTLWFRNTWAWGRAETAKPRLKKLHQDSNLSIIESTHPSLGDRWLYCEGTAELLFTENDTNYQKLFGVENKSDFVKDGINDYLINRDKTAIDPQQIGTKFAANYNLNIAAGETVTICLRLCDSPYLVTPFGKDFEQIFQTRIQEADEFYDRITSPCQLTPDRRNIQRQAFAGMLWAKQYYYYVIHEWLQGDPAHPTPAKSRQNVRNTDWIHLFNDDVISMPDKWEYPWYAA